jgi:hypothetical protein
MNKMLIKSQISGYPGEGEVLSGLIAYEDSTTRDRAMQTCDRLVQKFWKDLEFDFSWWRFDFFRDAAILDAAASAAVKADLILISAHAGRELPLPVQKWIDAWVPLRKQWKGMMVAMIGTGKDPLKGLTPIHVYLREAAQCANMDYLAQVVDAPLGRLDGSVEKITSRAEKVTSVLDNILHRPSPAVHHGINE